MSKRTLFIVYNADGTVLGKLKYGYRKLSSSSTQQPACAACELTHGGLSLTESAGWTAAKAEIEGSSDLKLAQLHRDEIGPAVLHLLFLHVQNKLADLRDQLKSFVQQSGLRYPLVALEEAKDVFKQVLSREDLAECKGSPAIFVEKLRSLGLMREQASL